MRLAAIQRLALVDERGERRRLRRSDQPRISTGVDGPAT
jgi:hypothetical protein